MPGKLGNVIPTVAVWQAQSNVLTARREAIILTVDKYLGAYNRATPRSSSAMESLAELYYCLDFWLKEYGRQSSQVAKGRAGVVQELYVLVVNKLCEVTGLTVNLLPRWLEETFGKGMVAHGFKKDFEERNAKYFTPGEVAKYRLSFNRGLAYQESWWANSSTLVLVDTVNNEQAKAEGKSMFPPEPDHQGYVLSMSRDFYMMKHITPKGAVIETGQYHSSYFSGESVLCAGTLKVEAGQIKTVTTASGHYAPGVSHLSNAIATLAMLGVDLDKVVGWVYGEKTGRPATEILRDRVVDPGAAASTFEAQRGVGLGFRRAAEVAAGARARAALAQKQKDEAEELMIVEHFKERGHSRFKCGVCKKLQSEGKLAKYLTALAG
jgi:hypothetical protein